MKKILLGKDLIVLDYESAVQLLILIDFLVKDSGNYKTTFTKLIKKCDGGFKVWQELRDSCKNLDEEK